MSSIRVAASAPRVGIAALEIPATIRPIMVAAVGAVIPCTYDIRERGTGRWERGSGSLVAGSPDTLQRTTVSAGSNSTAPVDFSGEIDITLTLYAPELAAKAAYPKTHATTAVLLPAAPVSRLVLIIVTVTTTFAAGDGAAPIFDIGEEGTLEKFKANLTTGTAGDVLIYTGTLSAGKGLTVDGTAATGTGDGAITVSAFALPDGA